MDGSRERFWARVARRPSILELAAAVAVTVMLLWAASDAGTDPFVLLPGVGLAFCLATAWGVHWLAAFFVRRARRFGEPLGPWEWAAWIVTPVLLLGAVAADGLEIPLRVRFRLSRPAFEEYVEQATEGNPAPAPARLGLYRVRSVEWVEGTPHVVTTGVGFFGEAGFARLPGGPPRESRWRYRRLTGDWYVISWDD